MMNKFKKHFTVLIPCFMSVCLLGADNLISNSNFEKWNESRTIPLDWGRNEGLCEYSSESEAGNASIKMHAIDHRGQTGSFFQRDIPVDGEQKLHFRARVKTEGAARAQALFRAQDVDGKNISPTVRWSGIVKDSPQWTDLDWTFITPPTTSRISIILTSRSDDKASGSVWYDWVSLKREGVTLQNSYLELYIDPSAGGARIQSLKLKNEQNNEFAYWDRPMSPGGLAADIMPDDSYPGILRDVIYTVSERDQSGRRTLLTHRPSDPENAGIKIDKEYILPEEGSYVEVKIKITNEGDVERKASLRIQNIIPPIRGIFTYPSKDYLGKYDLRKGHVEQGSWPLEELNEGWVAFASPEEARGIVFMFDKEQIKNAFCWLSAKFYTTEWAYQEQTLSPGGSWKTSYRIAPITSGLPVITAGNGIIAGITPLEIPLKGNASLDITAYDSPGKWELNVASGSRKIDYSFQGKLLSSTRIELPWSGEILMDLSFNATSGAINRNAFLHEQARFIKSDTALELPAAPDGEQTLAPEVASYFPFGGYLHGGNPGDAAERGSMSEYWRRSLRILRRNYMNTITGHLQMDQNVLSQAKQSGRDAYSELVRKHNMRIVPRQTTFRFYVDGSFLFIENITREQALEEWRKRGAADLSLLKWYAENYNDIILSYDISDEPEERFIPWYMHMRDIFREINPTRPAKPILQLYRLAYVPYVPIFFGDAYPITHGARNPWRAGDRTLQAVEQARGEKPVWVMPQAFGWERWELPNKAETRYMAYSIFANGGKGLIYHGFVNTSSSWLLSGGYDRAFFSSAGTWSPEWHILGKVARHLTAIGPATMGYLPVKNTGITVESSKIDLGHYAGEAIIANTLKKDDSGNLLIVVQNQDMTKGHFGKLIIPTEKKKGRELYDLKKLAPVLPADSNATSIEINFDLPGDAAIFYLGNKTELTTVISEVYKHHYLNEKAILNIDLELAENNNVAVGNIKETVDKAGKAFDDGNFKVASNILAEAKAELEIIINKSDPLGAAKSSEETARQLLSEVTEIYTKHLETFAPQELQQKVERRHRLPNGSGIRPAEVDKMVENTAQLIQRLNRAEDKLYLGHAIQVVDELRDVERLARENLATVAAFITD